jgi:hypothetical protein
MLKIHCKGILSFYFSFYVFLLEQLPFFYFFFTSLSPFNEQLSCTALERQYEIFVNLYRYPCQSEGSFSYMQGILIDII